MTRIQPTQFEPAYPQQAHHGYDHPEDNRIFWIHHMDEAGVS